MHEDTVPIFEENLTSAAIDGVRIGCVTAQALVMLDPALTEEHKVHLLRCIEAARGYLDAARETLAVENLTSVHVVNERSRIIVPGS